jgi:hypothetical protein
MGTATRPARSKEPKDALRCLISIPSAGVNKFPVLAHSFDRRGAVLQLNALPGERPDVASGARIELDLDLPDGGIVEHRLMRCLGKTVRCSLDSGGNLWLAVKFGQIHIRAAEPGPSSAYD